MTRPTPLSDLVADDLMLDRIGSRLAAGDDPVAGLLAAFAAHADSPIHRPGTTRRFRRHRALTALAALVVGASGAGVAAAVTIPDARPPTGLAQADPAPRLPSTGDGVVISTTGGGQVLVQRPDGSFAVVSPGGQPIITFGPAATPTTPVLADLPALLATVGAASESVRRGALVDGGGLGDGSITAADRPSAGGAAGEQLGAVPDKDPADTTDKATDKSTGKSTANDREAAATGDDAAADSPPGGPAKGKPTKPGTPEVALTPTPAAASSAASAMAPAALSDQAPSQTKLQGKPSTSSTTESTESTESAESTESTEATDGSASGPVAADTDGPEGTPQSKPEAKRVREPRKSPAHPSVDPTNPQPTATPAEAVLVRVQSTVALP